MSIIKASTKGQIVIPEKLREKYKIDQGTLLDILDGKNKIIILPMGKEPQKEGRGMLKGKTSLTKALLADRKKKREH
ncbi:AbrB/MazE/SpoVT family DNA-binding domain-containing protein [Candidatus Saganbacteria bacterium]|nr:AbrB/MazE/SpoVT family DNA-binding domain-containing protein [Candidatus Saganbacteria bacterium]